MEYSKENLMLLSEWYEAREPEVVFQARGKSGYQFVVVVDNTAIPAYFDSEAHFGKGGTRFTQGVDVDEVSELAKLMSKKNALPGSGGLYGGAKAGICPPEGEMPDRVPTDVIEEFAELSWMVHAGNDGVWGGPGCDMNFQEDSIRRYLDAVVESGLADDVRVATGRPSGEPYYGAAYDENGAAGRGVAMALETALEVIRENPSAFPDIPHEESVDVAVQGLGAMGRAVVERLDEMGHNIVAVSELSFEATIVNQDGLDVEAVFEAHESGGDVTVDGEYREMGDVFGVECDVLIPAAAGGVVNAENVDAVSAPFVLEAANAPVTREAKDVLFEDGVLVIAGESANFGGSVAASVELDSSVTEDVVAESLARTDQFVAEHIRELLETFISVGGFDSGCSPHYITDGIALERIVSAMLERGEAVPEEVVEIVCDE